MIIRFYVNFLLLYNYYFIEILNHNYNNKIFLYIILNRTQQTFYKTVVIMYRAISIYFRIKCTSMENGLILLVQRHSRYVIKIIKLNN